MWNDLLLRLRSLFRRKNVEAEVDEELRFHFEKQVSKFMQSGMPPQEAKRRARLEFGGMEQLKEEHRDARGISFVETLMQDVRYGTRTLRKSAGFASVAALTLSLGIGATTAVFSVIYAALIQPLPYHHPESIFYLQTWSPQGYTQPASYPEYLDWRRENHVFSAIAAFNSFGSANFEGRSGPIALRKVSATDNFFEIFGVAPYLGRTFAPGEDQPGKNDVAILSHEVWRQQFGSQHEAVGKIIKLDGRPYAILGVMPAGFRFPINVRNAIYAPLNMPKEMAEARGTHWLPTVARIKPEISREQAQADMNRVLADVGRAYPDQGSGRRMKLQSLASYVVGNAGAPLLVLIFAVLAVLAIGCVNIAGLLFARGVKRQREVAVRSALGASRMRLIRQALTETLLLGLLGAVGGTVLAYGLLNAIRTLLITAVARGAEVQIDKTALFVALTIAVLTSLLAGLLPALRLSAVAPSPALKTGGSAGAGRGQHRLRAAFIATQVALALVLLVTSGLLLRVLSGLRGTDLGFDPDRLLTSEIDLSVADYENRDVIANFYRPLVEKVQAIPGVKAAGLIQVLPIQNWGWNSDMHIVGHPPDPPNEERLAEGRFVTPGYFDALGISLIRGRLLDDQLDTPTSQPVVVVNEAFVKKFFSREEDPIGQYVEGLVDKVMIVGVVRSIRQNIYQPPMAEMDICISQIPPKDALQAIPSMSLVVRTAMEPGSVVSSLRGVFHELDPGLPFREPLTMLQIVADVLVLERLENWLFGAFAFLAVLLAIVGIYGLISHEVELSTREIGVRTALGAPRAKVLAGIYRRVGLMLLVGMIAGLLMTWAAHKLFAALVIIRLVKDAGIISGLALGFIAAALVAALIPACRAMRVDPIVALRYE